MDYNSHTLTNGPGAAAILSAAVGCFLNGLFFLVSDAYPSAHSFFQFYPPSGDLSGTTTSAIVLWLVLWFILAKAWRDKTLEMWKINLLSFSLLLFGLLLTFPPFVDLLQGK